MDNDTSRSSNEYAVYAHWPTIEPANHLPTTLALDRDKVRQCFRDLACWSWPMHQPVVDTVELHNARVRPLSLSRSLSLSLSLSLSFSASFILLSF